ncbi:MAG: class I SAM-dependent methyltransferase [Patescibacteria group bacterium]
MIYERGNAAKQWMLAELDRRFGDRAFRALDLAGGSGRIWGTFLKTHPNAKAIVVDTDAVAIKKGKEMYNGNMQIEHRVADAQHPIEGSFDVVTAMSAMEHVVDRPAFLKTVWSALSSGGVSYLNYDVGHFRSHNIKERLMVPLSQLLAFLKIEGPYMKKVDDALFRHQAESIGFRIEKTTKHNLHPLKGFMRGANDASLEAWFVFEDAMNAQYTADKLDGVMWSTTLIVSKP